jgi:hypothetical protein
MEQQRTKDDRSSTRTTATDRFMRRIVLPLVLLTGIYGLIRYVLVGG